MVDTCFPSELSSQTPARIVKVYTPQGFLEVRIPYCGVLLSRSSQRSALESLFQSRMDILHSCHVQLKEVVCVCNVQ